MKEKNVQVCIVGAFDFVGLATGGQPVKSRELFYALQQKLGSEKITLVETFGWKKHPFKMIRAMLRNIPRASIIIMLPAHKGLRVFSRLLFLLKKKEAKLFYDVIGGWLPEIVRNNKQLKTQLTRLNGIWVETSSMKEELLGLGISNVTVIPNFKHIKAIDEQDLYVDTAFPLKVCTFSRVVREKGIGDAISCVKAINEAAGKCIYELDIYGQIDPSYASAFQQLIEESPPYIRYKGVVAPEKSVETLRFYYLLLFPTKFFTEGVPGTLIDAYSAGVPVVTSLWKNYKDVFIDRVTGLGYEFNNQSEFEKCLLWAYENRDAVRAMKVNCVEYASRFHPSRVVSQILDEITMR